MSFPFSSNAPSLWQVSDGKYVIETSLAIKTFSAYRVLNLLLRHLKVRFTEVFSLNLYMPKNKTCKYKILCWLRFHAKFNFARFPQA